MEPAGRDTFQAKTIRNREAVPQGATRVNLGASMYAGFLQDKLRLTFGAMGFREDGFPGDILYINIGITDIPGFIYWFYEAL